MSIKLKASIENFQQFQDFIEESLFELSPGGFSFVKVLIVCEEIIVNICKYAYKDIPEMDEAYLEINIFTEENLLKIVFMDEGREFNPVQFDRDNRDLPIEKKEIGGLGLIMIKEFVDNISYEYKDNKNILMIEKELDDV